MEDHESHYDEIFKEIDSKKLPLRYFCEGEIGLKYKLPKYINYFLKEYSKYKDLTILELGAGDAYGSKIIRKILKPKRYVVSEINEREVENFKQDSFEAYVVDATDLSRFEDGSFDLVFCFDVMHHVDDPRKMAREMLRVTKKHFFLIEANGICLVRKFLELTPSNRKRGEKSYLPSTYKSFFSPIKKIKTKPFSFAFSATPHFLIKPTIAFSEFIERVPFFRWQCSSLLICGKKNE